jgi:carboxypeptidase family protein
MNRNVIAVVLLFPMAACAQQKSGPPVPASGNVTLPLDEYTHLLELAAKPRLKLETPPVPYAIKSADLRLRVNTECISGSVRLEGEIFNTGETKVPLSTGLTILDARQDGKALPLEQDAGTNTAVLAGPAEFSVTLNVGMPLSIEAGRASFVLPVPSAGSVHLTLVVPGDHSNVRLTPGLITSHSSSEAQTTVEATLVPGQLTSLSWATREIVEPAVPREVRFLSDVKTLVTVNEAELRIAVLADVTVVQGEPSEFQLELPPGYELTGATGASVESSDIQGGILTLKVSGPAQRSHEFLLSMEKPVSATNADAPFVTFKGAQRETGEVLIEGTGSIELTAKEGGGLKRVDFKETNPYLRSLAHFPLHAAFRYHKQPGESPSLALEWTRFPDSGVLAAVAERAEVTTLVTSEGRSLTEIKLTVKNQAQPFLRVTLPAGASILSAEVGGEKVKPVEGPDGNRVPLLRAGFRPTDSYTVAFVFLHSGTPFTKRGGSELRLPKMDVPISVLNWEVFLPQQYKVKDFGGDVISANLLQPSFVQAMGMAGKSSFEAGIGVGTGSGGGMGSGEGAGVGGSYVRGILSNLKASLLPGQLGGFIVDANGALIPNAQITVIHAQTGTTQHATTDALGYWLVSNIPSGPVKVTASANGFQASSQDINYDASQPTALNSSLNVGSVSTTITVNASISEIRQESRRIANDLKRAALENETAASPSVLNLQRRVSGVLPVRIDVPRAGNSYRFVRPLVVDEETKVTFAYKSK